MAFGKLSRERFPKNSLPLIVGGVAYFATLLYLIFTLPTWGDEEYTFATTSGGVLYAIAHAFSFEQQPPLYFALVALWRSFGSAVWWVRLLSVLFLVPLPLVIVAIARRVAPQSRPAVVVAFVMLQTFVVWAAVEARGYTLDLLIGSCLTLAFVAGYLPGSSRRARGLFFLVSLIAVYQQYYFAFVLIGMTAALIVARRWTGLWALLASNVLVLLALLPAAQVIHAQVGEASSLHVGVIKGITNGLSGYLPFLLPRDWLSSRHLVYDVIFVGALAALAFARPQIDRLVLAYASIVAVALMLFVAVGTFGGILVYSRHEVVLFFPSLVVLLLVLTRLRSPKAAIARRFLAAIYLVATFGSLITLFGNGTRDGDWIRVAAFLNRSVSARDVVVVFGPEETMPLGRYYKGSAEMRALPHPASLVRYDFSALVLHGDGEVEAAIAPRVLGGRRVWLVTGYACEATGYGCEYLRNVVARDYRVLQEQRFFGSEVQELEPR
ncbi:MAG TPA: hypothetical protein VGZ00_03030 [Candidatus Baltobacteraceae bacterium]|nr:hypothetical protein [Candidatus Baltobacteraceae bacterium]